MRFAENRVGRQRRSNAADSVWGERLARTLSETIEFISPGDQELLEQVVQLDERKEWDVKSAAFAALHLVYEDLGVSKETKQARVKHIETDRWPYEENIREASVTGRLPGEIEYDDVLGEAARLFRFNRILKEPLVKPSEEIWKQMVTHVKRQAKGPDGSAAWYSSLLAVDQERFYALDLSDVRNACVKDIEQQRMKHPVTKDSVQFDLLKLVALTRLMFPDLVGPASLKQEERRVMYACLARNRELMRRGAGDSPLFPEYFYYLALVEAPQMKVDSTGIHLFTTDLSIPKARELPQRVSI